MKIMFVLKLPPISSTYTARGKRAAISKLACVSQKRIRSYIVLAIVYFANLVINKIREKSIARPQKV